MKYFIFIIICLISSSSYGQNYRHASTYEEGLGRAIADVIRSSGKANYYHSEAALNYEDVISKRIDNRLKWTETYFEMKRINREFRYGNIIAPSREELARRSKAKCPSRMNDDNLDRDTGELTWPVLFRSVDFEKYRNEIEWLISIRADRGHSSIVEIIRINKVVNEIELLLRSYSEYIPTKMSIDGRRFLKSLKYEIQFPVDS